MNKVKAIKDYVDTLELDTYRCKYKNYRIQEIDGIKMKSSYIKTIKENSTVIMTHSIIIVKVDSDEKLNVYKYYSVSSRNLNVSVNTIEEAETLFELETEPDLNQL